MTRCVVITGTDGVTAFGENWQAASARLLAYENVICKMPKWRVYDGLHTLPGAPIGDFTLPERYTCRRIRAMRCVSLMSARVTELALEQAGLIGDRVLTNDGIGITYGSSAGSTGSVSEFATMPTEKHIDNITGITYIQVMPHTAAVNAELFFGLRGQVIPTSSVCTSGSQAIGYAWEVVRHGYQTVMVAGGAEGLCPSEAAILDALFATSQCNDEPRTIPSPFDEKRDDLAIREGADTLVSEELEHAKACGVMIYGEIVGSATSCDVAYIIQPQHETMWIYMERSLNMAGISVRDIGYTSAHEITTSRDDAAESQATSTIYDDNVPLSSLKGYSGHTLGACGALETWMGLQMMREGWFAPTLNLSQPNVNHGTLDYIMGEARKIDCEFLQNSSFAFGGINTSTIIKRWP